jgi:hypothetical protein
MPRLVLLLALLLPAASPVAEELVVTDTPIYPNEVPPGTRDDQLLYLSLRAGTAELRQEMTVASQVLFEARQAGLNVEELEKGATPDEQRRTAELRASLEPRWTAARDAIPRTNVLGCRYTVMHLEGSMIAQEGTEPAKRLPVARAEAKRCDVETKAALAELTSALGSLRGWLDQNGPEIRQRRAARGLPPEALAPPGVKLPATTEKGAAAPTGDASKGGGER